MPSLTPETWARVRYEYERTTRPVEEICAAHGISSGTLRDRMRRWHWTRRRPPVPRDGPPALTIALLEAPLLEAPQRDAPRRAPEPDRPAPTPGETPLTVPVAASDDRLHEMAARLAPAIQTAIARLAAASTPRDLEQTARALSLLTRSLRELDALSNAGGGEPDAAPDDDPVLEDPDEFRLELARRINAFVDAHQAREADESGKP